VVFFYGGSWKDGSRAQYRFAGEALTSKGFIAVIADYRHFPEVRFPAFQTDAALALRWTVDHIAAYNGDPDAIFVMGHSAGAHMGALLAVDPTHARAAGVNDNTIKGFIGLAGPYAMVPSQVNSIRDVFAGLPDENVARPVHFVTAAGPKPPPMLLLYGLGDKTVGRANASEFAARVRSTGGEATVIEYPDITHPGIILAMAHYFRDRAPVLEDAAAFVGQVARKH
jgi:acetyl esterase/lipase